MKYESLSSLLPAGSDSACKQFQADGAIIIRDLLGMDEVDQIRQTFTSHVESHRDLGYDDHVPSNDILSQYPRFVHPHRHPETDAGSIALGLMLDARILGIVTKLIGPSFGAQSMFYFKPPGARGQGLHQDNDAMETRPGTCLAFWIAIDDADAENGGLMVVPGTQHSEIIREDGPVPWDTFDHRQVRVPPGLETVQTVLRAGDALLFNGNLIHGSSQNLTTDRFRRALIFHYIPQVGSKSHLKLNFLFQTTQHVNGFYLPLLTPEGKEISLRSA